jgi:hypothetical protein
MLQQHTSDMYAACTAGGAGCPSGAWPERTPGHMTMCGLAESLQMVNAYMPIVLLL